MLAEWLAVPPQQLNYGDEIARKVSQQRSRWDSGVGYQDRLPRFARNDEGVRFAVTGKGLAKRWKYAIKKEAV